MVKFYYYSDGLKKSDSPEELKTIIKNKDLFVWVDIYDADQVEIQKILKEICGFHYLTVESCLSFTAHPKVDEYDDYIFVIFHSLNYYECENRISTRELDAYIGKNFLVTYHYKVIECVDLLEKKLEKENKFIQKGSDILYYFLMDKMMDRYFVILEQMDRKISDLEDAVFNMDTNSFNFLLTEINALKKNTLLIRKIMVPQIKAIKEIFNSSTDIIQENHRVYYKDILDHLNKTSDMVNVNLDLIKGTFDTCSSLLSNKTNETMKVLTIIATIMMPLTFIVGLYGMNFRYMPELDWKYGYLLAIVFMAVIAISMLLFMKKKKWL